MLFKFLLLLRTFLQMLLLLLLLDLVLKGSLDRRADRDFGTTTFKQKVFLRNYNDIGEIMQSKIDAYWFQKVFSLILNQKCLFY